MPSGKAKPAPGLTRGLTDGLRTRGPGSSPGRLALALGLALIAQPALAKYDFCYIVPPAGAIQTDAVANPFFGFEYAMVPWAAKRLCGLDAEGEIVTLRAAYQKLGCTPESDVGRQIEQELAITDVQTINKAVFGGASAPDLTASEWQGFCEVAADLTLLDAQFKDDAGLTDDDKLMIEKMEPLWRRLFEISETLPRD